MKSALWLAGLIFSSAAMASETDALSAALADCIQRGDDERPFVRYVWIPDYVDPAIGAAFADYAVNLACSNGPTSIVPGQEIRPNLRAYDLRLYVLTDDDRSRLRQVWDQCATRDPVFHVSELLQEGGQPVPILAPHLAAAAVRDVTGEQEERIDVLLTEFASTPAPIYELRFILEELLDRSYYAFRGVKAGDDLGTTLSRLGYYYAQAVKDGGISADLRFRSRITGDQRVVYAFHGTRNPTAATITFDLFDGNDSPEGQFSRNLLDVDAIEDGREIFAPLPNGLVEFLLADGQNRLVETAPSNLAVDYTKPHANDVALRPALSCLSCHTREDGSGMYRAIEDDSHKLPDLLDLSDQILRESIYGRDLDQPDGILGRARRDYEAAVGQIVDLTEEGSFNRFHGELVALLRGYRYDSLDADRQAEELGFDPTALDLSQLETADPEVVLATDGETLTRTQFDTIRAVLAAAHLSAKEPDE